MTEFCISHRAMKQYFTAQERLLFLYSVIFFCRVESLCACATLNRHWETAPLVRPTCCCSEPGLVEVVPLHLTVPALRNVLPCGHNRAPRQLPEDARISPVFRSLIRMTAVGKKKKAVHRGREFNNARLPGRTHFRV